MFCNFKDAHVAYYSNLSIACRQFVTFLDIDSNCEEDQVDFEELEPGISDTAGISEEDKLSISSSGSSKSLHYDIQRIRNISSQLSMSRHHMNRHMSTIETQTQNQN